MKRWNVNATVTFVAWVQVEAHTAEEAIAQARCYDASDFDYDRATGQLDFGVTPIVDNA